MYLVSVCVAVSTFTKRSTHCAYSVMWTRCFSRAIMYKNGTMEGISVETLAKRGNYKIAPLNFQWTFH
jgi:hypothetical protein